MKLLLPALATTVLIAAPAFAQGVYGSNMAPPPGTAANPIVSSQTYPSPGAGTASPAGIEGVNPAPGAQGAYVGAGRHGFYDVWGRLSNIQGRLGNLPPGQRGQAASALRQITANAKFRRARDGGTMRDWDREFINHKLDLLIGQYPGLGPQG